MKQAAFGFTLDREPLESAWMEAPTERQQLEMENQREYRQVNDQAWRIAQVKLMDAFEIPLHLRSTKATFSVLLSFWINAQPGSKKSLENEVMETLYGQGRMF